VSLFIFHRFAFVLILISTVLFTGACAKPDRQVSPVKTRAAITMKITSPGFAEGQPIPSKYTCDGENVSPALSWDQVPPAAKAFTLICDDPDAPAGTWVHWVLYDLPASNRALREGIQPAAQLPSGASQGHNDFRQSGYGGPCPPPGTSYRYYFKVYALDGTLGLKPGATKADVETAMKGHILGEGQLMGTYKRK